MRTITIDTTPTVLLSSNAKRVRWTITFTPSSIVAGNTGLIFIGRGFTPNAVAGDANQGDVLNAGSSIEEKKQFEGDTLPYKGMIFIVSNTASQQVTVDEQNEGE